VHGANRLGSNSLSECAVWGRLTGEQAAKYAVEKPEPSVNLRLLEAAKGEEARIFDKLLHTEAGGVSVYELAAKLSEAMEEGVGILRHPSKMAEAIAAIKKIGEELARVRLEDRGRVYNSNLRDLLQLAGMVKAAEAVAKGAYLREESRGAHYRLDYPRKDERWG
jgi:succinate dehydrogenase / fumarate reductase flavoprotein subunit